MAAALLVGCTTPPAWTAVPLEATADSLVVTEDALLVGGHRDTAPFLARLDGTTSVPITLHAGDPYAAAATLVALGADQDRRYALGTAIGGAHSNARWSVWMGSATELTSYPQEFFTFGGHDAGPLLGVATADHQPLIVGVRTTGAGMRAALYTVQGTKWSPLAPDPALSSDTGRELSFTAVATAGDQVVLVGDELLLTPDLPQSAAVWIGRPGSWQFVRLPTPEGLLGTGPVWANSVACESATCWVAGWARGRPVAWQLRLPDLTVVATSVLDDATSATTAKAVVTISDGHPVVATNGDAPTVVVGCGNSWRSLGSPGPAQSLAATSTGVYAISAGQLRFSATPRC
jgi:hypothetical protein